MTNQQQQLINRLKSQLKAEQLLTDPAQCLPYSFDYSRRQVMPLAVVFAEQHEQVSWICKQCYELNIPIVARGRGTGIPGGAVPVAGGIVISFERMNHILDIDIDNRIMRAQPGVLNAEIQRAASQHGFFWAPDPSSSSACSLGGNLAYNSAGPRAVKYGTTRENTLGLKAVLANGETLTCGYYTTKGCVGYDLTRLLIGSEGTLALITEATLKLTPIAQGKISMRLLYNDLNQACVGVANMMKQSITPYTLELMDAACVSILRKNANIDLPQATQALLLVEFDGMQASLKEGADILIDAATNNGLIQADIAHDQSQVQQLWQARKALSPALRDIAPKKINEDIVVPVSQLAEFIAFTQDLAAQYQLKIVNFGHAGNGNIHVNLLVDPNNEVEMTSAHQAFEKIIEKTLALKGSISGEHGVGLDKLPYIEQQIGKQSLNLMRAIKQQFDPNNILNPGKLIIN